MYYFANFAGIQPLWTTRWSFNIFGQVQMRVKLIKN